MDDLDRGEVEGVGDEVVGGGGERLPEETLLRAVALEEAALLRGNVVS